MGVTIWPCPGCGQAQRQEHPNGEAVETRPCAACREHIREEIKAVLADSGTKKEKTLAVQLILQRYGAKEQDAQISSRLITQEGAVAEA
jgi:hypothetical protein